MKAILVIDKPESCTSCLLGIYNKKWFCLDTNKDIDICDRYNIPEWCPLKPMPQKKEAYAESYTDRADEFSCKKHPLYAQGWNECLEEIEK